MKHFRLIAALSVFALLSITTNAQPKDHCNWQERMMSEKIAFFTSELDLTPEEAQAFWPLYNKISKEKMESQKAMMTSYHTLLKALETGSDKEIDKLLDAYLEAKQAHNESAKDEATKYRKVLPGKKVAKLYVAEEKFRRQHIRNMKGGGHQTHGNRPAEGR